MAEPVLAAEKDLTNKGEVIVRENCARCHAVGQTDESPNAEAPPFRVLSQSYPVESLAESLAEGIMSGHPDMPVFVFKPHDVDAIIAYLESIQVPADAAPSDPTPSAPGESEAMDSKG
ncbi:MAG: cytochrome c [Methyloceanibacter sp.]